ncbi:DNA-3-methyladenine glycosylase [Pengzhenrongella phosphoraccumulans]|uniref:DNA-3-methyladenine glycosylase n=1 Tax=Pengzhenrongella phosphoraccumulans TaxID=3114394 RepID=UPI00388DD817
MTRQVATRAWFERDVLHVAHGLLGALITTTHADGPVTVRLTEVEAYRGAADPASHAFRGPSARNATMFGAPGRLYVYRHLGIHACANVVCGPHGEAAAVLLRAGEVTDGRNLARARRTLAGVARTDRDLARGPARLAVALGIDLTLDGTDVVDPGGVVVVHLAGGPTAGTVRSGPRVGVSGPGADGARFGWRFWLADEPTVSDFRAGGPRAASPGRDARVRGQVRQTRPDTASSLRRPHDEEDLRE